MGKIISKKAIFISLQTQSDAYYIPICLIFCNLVQTHFFYMQTVFFSSFEPLVEFN